MRSPFTHFVRSLAKFTLFAVMLYIVLVCIWGEYAPTLGNANLKYLIGSQGYLYTRLKEVKHSKNVDILFLGSSHTYRGFDTRIFKDAGLNSFNLGSSAQTPIQTEVLLRRYLDELNPKTIIYEMNPIGLVSDGVESSLDIISNDRIDLQCIRMALQQNNIKIYNTLIYGLYRQMLNKNSGFKENPEKKHDRYISGGYVERDLQYYKHVKHDKVKSNFYASQFNSFESVIHMINERKIRLILVQAPVTPARYESYLDNDEFDRKMSQLGEYYQFNELIQLDDSLHFYDSHHLNQRGVELFNKKLLSIVFPKNLSANTSQQ